MKKKFAKDKQAKQANLRQRMRELKKVFKIVCQIKPFKNAYFAQCVQWIARQFFLSFK